MELLSSDVAPNRSSALVYKCNQDILRMVTLNLQKVLQHYFEPCSNSTANAMAENANDEIALSKSPFTLTNEHHFTLLPSTTDCRYEQHGRHWHKGLILILNTVVTLL